MNWCRKLALIALVVALAATAPVLAQTIRGSLFLTVTTEEGETVSGAEVKLLSQNITRTMTSDADGHVRFTSLDAGTYSVEIKKEGYNIAIYEGIVLATGQDVEMSVSIQASDIVETVVVTSETPVVDRRKLGTETIISPDEMEKLPQARDPWAILSTVPGLQTDRINVGGNQSGQQSNFASKGDDGFQTQWVMDGVDFSDLAAQGGSATYFDFNMFQEIAFTTGGGSLEQTQPGVAMNFVSKQGSNRHTGSIGLVFANNDLQDSSPQYTNPDGSAVAGNRIDENFEKFFEIGGPVLKDKLWYWFGFSQNDINILVPGATPGSRISDRTKLQSLTGKLNGTVGGKTNYQVFYTNTDKIKQGRNAGPTRPPETSWDQEGPSPIYSGEIGHFITPNLELSLQASRVEGGFSLTPQGTAPAIVQDPGGVSRNTYYGIATDRPTNQYALRANWFAETGNLSHELKFGFKLKEGEVTTTTTYGTDNIWAFQIAPGFGVAYFIRASAPVGAQMDYTHLWAGDTILWNNFTFNIGATYWQQSGEQLQATIDANPVLPNDVPALNFGGFTPAYEWEDILIRAGATYQFDTARRQVLRASFNQYADQLGYGDVVYNNPASPGGIGYLWYWDDSTANPDSGQVGNNDFVVDPSEVDTTAGGFFNSYGIDLANPSTARPVDFLDTNLEAPVVDELIVGYEIEVMPNLSIGANFTQRIRDNVTWTPLVDMNTVVAGSGEDGDFSLVPTSAYVNGTDGVNTAGSLPSISGTVDCDGTAGPCTYAGNGDAFTVMPYYLDPTGFTDTNRAQVLTNRPGYEEEYQGIELTVNKRLSNKWMLRGYVAWQDWTKNIPAAAIQNPANLQGDTTKDGSIVVASGGTRSGSFGNVYYGTSTWSYNVNALYQLPKNFTVSANLNGREGYNLPLYADVQVRDVDGIGSTPNMQINDADSYRFDDLHILDLRLGYLLRLSGNTTVDLGLEVFNVFDDDTILQNTSQSWRYTRSAGSTVAPRSGRIEEVLSPRIMRLSARVTF